MASGPETNFIKSVHRLLPPVVYALKNHNEYVGGVADVWYDGLREDLWVEYKFVVVPKRDDTYIDLVGGKEPVLSKLQQQWLRDRHNNGRNVAVIVGCKDGGVWLEDREWEDPISTAEFRRNIRTRAVIAKLISDFCCG